MNTLREILNQGKKRLIEAQVPEADADAWVLMEFAFGIEKSYYFLHENDRIEKEQRQKYENLIALREKRIPLQQITGKAWFMGYEFCVDERVLTPRFDTEILAEEAGKLLRPGMRLLDMCTGSGCILLSLLAEYQSMQLEGVGVDISPDALQVAGMNRERLGVDACLVESDLFAQVEGRFDIIVSNPPYIASGELPGLMPEVRDHEPWIALDGKEDGLYFYRRIVEQAGDYMNPGGWLCFEIGYDQGKALEEMLKAAAYEEVRIEKDLAGLDRVAVGRKPQDTRI